MPQTQGQIVAAEIAALVAATPAVTNFNQGSVIRGVLDGPAAEGALLDQQISDAVATAVLNAAYGIYGITPLPALPSVYLLTFSNTNSSAQTIAASTLCSVSGGLLQWATNSILTVPAQSGGVPGTASVPATCQTAGSGTVVAAGLITQIVTPIAGVSVTNPSGQPISGGTDAETTIETQARLNNQINATQKGSAGPVEFGVLQSFVTDAYGNPIEFATKAKADDYTPTPGCMYVYAYGSNGTPSSALLAAIAQNVNGYTNSAGQPVPGWKAAGVIPTYLAAIVTTVDVTVYVLPVPAYTLSMLTSPVTLAIQAFFAALAIEQALSVDLLTQAVLQVSGVADAQVSQPDASLPSIPQVATPADAPTAAAASGSTDLDAGTYLVGYTFENPWGETEMSPTSSVTITEGQQINVDAITLPLGAESVNYYLSVSAGSDTLAYDATGTGAEEALTALPAAGAASPPGSNTCNVAGNLYVLGTCVVQALSPY